MARYFTTFSNRGKAYVHAHKEVGRTLKAQTLYVVSATQPPMYLVGEPEPGMVEGGATPLLTIVPGMPVAETNDTVALLEERVVELQAELAEANRECLDWKAEYKAANDRAFESARLYEEAEHYRRKAMDHAVAADSALRVLKEKRDREDRVETGCSCWVCSALRQQTRLPEAHGCYEEEDHAP